MQQEDGRRRAAVNLDSEPHGVGPHAAAKAPAPVNMCTPRSNAAQARGPRTTSKALPHLSHLSQVTRPDALQDVHQTGVAPLGMSSVFGLVRPRPSHVGLFCGAHAKHSGQHQEVAPQRALRE